MKYKPQMFWSIMLMLYLIYLIYLYKKVNKIFNDHKFLAKKEVIASEEYPAFGRADYPKWNKTHFFICGALFLLPRLILGMVSLFCCYFGMKLACKIYGVKDPSKPLPPKLKKINGLIVGTCSRILLFFNGFLWIENKIIKIKEDQYSYFVKEPESEEAIIVSNHTNCYDMLAMLSNKGSICYIANSLAKNYFLVGPISSIAQCIFVDRCNKDSRKKCFEDIKQRIANIKKTPNSKCFNISLK
jgi:hypothetical protein